MMEKSENSASKNTCLDDATKLAIREEVERRLDNPTASLVKFIEDEVKQRVKRQEWAYGRLIGLFMILVAAFAYALWSVELPKVVINALTAEGALTAQQQITNILAVAKDRDAKLDDLFISAQSHVGDANSNLSYLVASVTTTANTVQSNLNDLPNSVNTNLFVPLRNRLNQLKRQDNFLLVGDLSNLFVRQLVTSLGSSNNMALDYEPIPETVKIYGAGNNLPNRVFNLDGSGYCDGKTIIFTNLTGQLQNLLNRIQNGGIEVEYVRKSPR